MKKRKEGGKKIEVLKDWMANHMVDDVNFFDKVLDSYQLGMGTNGEFVIPKEKSVSGEDEKVSKNQVKLNLKRDYEAAGRVLSGKALDRAVDLYLEGKKKQIIAIISDPKNAHLVRMYEV